MSSQWTSKPLGEHCLKIGSGATPTGGKDGYQKDGPFALIRSQNVHNESFKPNGLAFISEEQAKKLDGVAVESGDVLLNITGDSVARVCQALPKYLPARVNQHVAIIRPKPSDFDSRFVRYFLASPAQQDFMLGLAAAGATRNALTKVMIERFEIPCPPFPIQRGIADALTALDDRITLLRETNTTLEAIAQALFKSWFVDFDPVRAKQEGRAPEGMSEDTAALFPHEFEESELGLVPKGWPCCPFRDTIDVIGGGTPKTSVAEYWGGEIPWFSVVDAPNATDVFVVDTEKRITEAGLTGSSTKLLPTGTTIISARGTVGRLALTGQPMAMNQSCYGLRGRAGDDFFTYFSTTRLVDQLKQRAHGSVFDTITQETFSGVFLSYPSREVILAFDEVVKPLLDRVKENLFQAKTLATLRDTLLPRLISGQLRLPEAEGQMTEAIA